MNARLSETASGYSQDLSHLPPVDCAPWCAEGKGHTDAIHPDDQRCHGDSTRLPLRRERLLDPGEDPTMSFLDVDLWREWNAAEGHISVGKDEEWEFTLTLDEAKLLAAALLERIAAARATG